MITAMMEPTQKYPILSGPNHERRPGITRTIPRWAVDIYCITHPKGEEYANEKVWRLVLAGRLNIVSGELNATSNSLTKAAGQHGINR